jgi:hypothetical protein
VLWAALGRRRRRRERIAEVRELAGEDQLALGDDIRELDVDISMPGADAGAKEDYGKALDCYEAAGKALDRSKTLGDLATVPAKLEEGRWLMESARARLAGKPPPERRAPCFFDPRHGPSVRDVDWAPDGGSVRAIPVCAADATRLEDGQDPKARTIVLHGRRVPYWEAPPYYGPYAGGYYGDYGGKLNRCRQPSPVLVHRGTREHAKGTVLSTVVGWLDCLVPRVLAGWPTRLVVVPCGGFNQ